VERRRGGHLLHGSAGPDARLNLTWSQLALQLHRHLSESLDVAARRGPQPLIGRNGETLAPVRVFEDDHAILSVPHDPQRAHPALRSPLRSSE
jgi:hypothetical protein